MSDTLLTVPEDKIDLTILESGGVELSLKQTPAKLTPDEARGLGVALLKSAEVATPVDPDNPTDKRIPMQYLQIEASTENTDDPKAEGSQTGIVHCFIRDQSSTNAVYIAVGWVSSEGWDVLQIIENASVTATDFADTDLLQYYEQALVDDEVFVFEEVDEEAEGAES